MLTVYQGIRQVIVQTLGRQPGGISHVHAFTIDAWQAKELVAALNAWLATQEQS